jgi:hypothetical protein
VDKGHDPDGPSGESPAVLEGKLVVPRLGVRIFKVNLKHLGEVLSKMVRGGSLEGGREKIILHAL